MATAEEAWWGPLLPLANPGAAPANLASQCTLPSAVHMVSSPRQSITPRFGDASAAIGTTCHKQNYIYNSLVTYWQ